MTPDQFLLFADPLPEPMLLLTVDGLILASNRAVEVRLGIAPQTFCGRQLAEAVSDPPEDVSHYLRACSRSRQMVLGSFVLTIREGQDLVCRTEGSLVRPRAEEAEALLMLRLIPKESAVGQFITLNQRIEELGREIQRRKLAEEAARQQEEHLRVTLLSIGDAVITTDTAGRITNLNAVAEALTGWKNADAVDVPLTQVFNIVNEKTRQSVANPAMRALEEGAIVGLANHTVLIAKDGTERPIDDSAAPVRSKLGEVVGCVLVFRDITERNRQEQEREATHGTLATLIERCPFGIYIVDADFRIANINVRSEAGAFANVRPVVGRAFDEAIRVIWPEPVALSIIQIFRHTLDTGKPYYSKDFVNPRADIDQIEGYEWELHRITLQDGRHGVVCYYYDSTKLRQAEQALRDADRRKDEFLATLAHELRNPLAPIRNGLQVMRLAKDNAEAVEQSRAMMERQLDQMVRLVDDLMDVSRISRGKLELKTERVQLAAVVNSALETSRPLIEQMSHELTVMLPKYPLVVEADPTRLAQVFLNLLNNAAKYSDRGGHIRLTAERQGSDVLVSVIDNGIGIASDQLPSIFDLFSQVDRSLEKSQGGLGIGLTLVKSLVEMHGGRIEAKSNGLGKGSEFVVRLPVVVEASGPPEAEEKPKGDARSYLRILIVDDNRDSADSLGMMLKIMGNQTRTAYDGEEAVAATQQFRPDVILLDIGLPKLNGYDACRRIREQPGGKTMVIIAQTGWGQDEDRQRTHDAGFDCHMVKPVDPTALTKILAELSDAATMRG